MVFLTFRLVIPAPLPKVWNYFSKFQNIAEWDPNVKTSVPRIKTDMIVGSQYDLVTIWKGKQSNMTFQCKQYKQHEFIKLAAKTYKVTSIDLIKFKGIQGSTQVTYEANISLNHLYSIATPFILTELQTLCDEAKAGMHKRSLQLF